MNIIDKYGIQCNRYRNNAFRSLKPILNWAKIIVDFLLRSSQHMSGLTVCTNVWLFLKENFEILDLMLVRREFHKIIVENMKDFFDKVSLFVVGSAVLQVTFEWGILKLFMSLLLKVCRRDLIWYFIYLGQFMNLFFSETEFAIKEVNTGCFKLNWFEKLRHFLRTWIK